MSKKPILISCAVCALAISFLSVYFTMFANVNNLDFFFNRVNTPGKDSETSDEAQPTETAKAAETETMIPQTQQPQTTPDNKTDEYTDISISAAGDFLIHSNLLTAQYKETEKIYDFNSIFSDVKEILLKADYTAASLEVPFGGSGIEYSGFPKFNCPDSLVDAAKNSGINMLLTAGTHSFDAGEQGFSRTLETIRASGLESTGTIGKEDDKNYIVKDIKGVKVGMVNYTAAERKSNGRIYLNGIQISSGQEKLINFFEYDKLDNFYSAVKNTISNMKNDGAELFIVFIRWGTDYDIKVNNNQKNIAQKLSDAGADIIFGNGPHVIQPFEAIKSAETGKTTLCMYSLGNFLSNQRKELVNLQTGHTEDGIIYTVNIRKHSDGKIELKNVEYIPTWVNLTSENQGGKQVYLITPLTTDIDAVTNKAAKDSYIRTKALVDENIGKYNTSAIDGSTV